MNGKLGPIVYHGGIRWRPTEQGIAKVNQHFKVEILKRILKFVNT